MILHILFMLSFVVVLHLLHGEIGWDSPEQQHGF